MTTQYQAAQDTDTPFRRWRFEEASGTTWTDDEASTVATISGSASAGFANSTSYDSAGSYGGSFAGGNASISSVSGWTSLETVEVLVNFTSIPSTTRPAIFSHAWSTGQVIPFVFGFNLDGSHAGLLGLGYYNGSAWQVVHMSTGLTAATFYHLVGVYDGSTTLTIYVNGSSVATATVTARGAGTVNSTAYIARRWDQPETISGQIWDLALYTTALSSTRVTAHYTAAVSISAVRIHGGGKPTFGNGVPIVGSSGVTISGGGQPKIVAPSLLLVPGDGTTWTTGGELSAQPAGASGPVQWWLYTAQDSGTLTADTKGTDWNTVVTVYASDKTTVLGTDSTTGGNASVTVSVTAATTYYVAVTRGTGADNNSGRYYLNAVGPRSGDAPPSESPAPAPPSIPSATSPPAGMTRVPIKRVSTVMPAPTIVAGRPTQPWTGTTTTSDWGNFRVVCAGVDVTFFRGYPVQILEYQLMEPFGCGPARILFPGITPHDAVGTGDTNWLIGGYAVDIIGPSGTIWSGAISSQTAHYDADRGSYTIDCIGDIWVADLVLHQPRTYLPPVDIGNLIPVELNQVPHRHINSVAKVTTGILTNQRGASTASVIGRIQELLGTAVTAAGAQWTVGRVSGSARTYQVALKDTTTVTWHVRAGQPGVEINLQLDSSTATNRVFGRGINASGYAWAGWVYPMTGIAAAPGYPNSSPSSVLTVGTTDASTTSGTGVSDWQRRVNETGIVTVTVDGTYSSADAAAAKLVQARMGLSVDGIVGPQTWAATFDVGNDGTDLTAAYRAPLASLTSVTPLLTRADGSFGAANPSDNPNLLVVDRDEDFGDGITKAQAITSAQGEIARTANPGWAGEIVLRADPEDIARWDIREGSNGVVKGWVGRDVTVHVAGVRAAPPSDGDATGTVTLTVDEHARDLVTLGQILRRDLQTATNPALLVSGQQRRSKSRTDNVVEYDGESSGGIIPRHALYGGLWTVIRIPVSQAGKVAQVVATTSPATPFVLAFFGDIVTPADLKALVGANPLAERGDGYGPFDWDADKLAARGFIEALGGPGQACGYSPGYQTSPYNNLSTALTGKLISTGSWTYQSVRPPWLWLAEYAVSSTFISGRLYPAPLDT